MRASVRTSPSISADAPQPLFRMGPRAWDGYAVAADGRFLAIVPDVVRSEAPVDVITGWRPPR
jgi:hypothetical protein